MKVPVYNQEGREEGTTLLPKEAFELELNPDLVHQVVVSQMANRRKVLAHTKDRGEVSGGGRKPWRQKGTGRARHGSIRSPLWIGGGVTFGPTKERVFSKKINVKMKRRALLQVLSEKVRRGQVLVVENLGVAEGKTRLLVEALKKLPTKGSTLIVLPKKEEKILRAANNLPQTSVVLAKDLNALDILYFQYLIISKDSIKVIKETFLK